MLFGYNYRKKNIYPKRYELIVYDSFESPDGFMHKTVSNHLRYKNPLGIYSKAYPSLHFPTEKMRMKCYVVYFLSHKNRMQFVADNNIIMLSADEFNCTLKMMADY